MTRRYTATGSEKKSPKKRVESGRRVVAKDASRGVVSRLPFGREEVLRAKKSLANRSFFKVLAYEQNLLSGEETLQP